MTTPPTTEGTIPFNHPSLPKPCETYYKVIGDLSSSTTPLILIHGGPGTGHEYMLPFVDLYATHGIPLIFYDQIGCAASTHLREKAGDTAFWSMALFHAELDNLIDHLNLHPTRDDAGDVSGKRFDILGHSWGGRVAASYAALQRPGLRRLIIASGLASTDLAIQGNLLLRKEQMPEDIARALNEAEERDEYQSAEYKAAMDYFYRHFFFRTEPFPPPELAMAFKHRADDTTVPDAVLGPTAAKITGSMKGWSCVQDLHKIAVPTLVYNGEYDTSHDVATKPFFNKIPRVRWITFGNAGHMCHIEGGGMRARVMGIVGDFLADDD